MSRSRKKTLRSAPANAGPSPGRQGGYYERVMAWVPAVIAGLTPFVVIYHLVRPQVGQSFVFRTLVFAAMALLGLGWAGGWRPFPRRLPLPVALAGLYCMTIGLSLINSRVPLFSLKQAMLPVCGFLFFGLIIAAPDRRPVLERLCLTFAVAACLLAAHGILQYFGFDLIRYGSEIPKNSVIATIGHPNYLSAVLGPGFFVVLGYLFTTQRRRWRSLAGAGGMLILFAIVLARTRSVWLGVAIGSGAVLVLALLYGYHQRIGLRWVKGCLLGGLAGGLAIGVMLLVVLPALGMPVNLKERFQLGIEIKSRFYYWYAAYERGLEKPLIGQGHAMFDPMFWDYAVAQQKSEMGPYFYDLLPAISGSTPGHVHNEYLEVFCEQGLAGLTALLAFIGFFLYFGVLAIVRQPQPAHAFRDIFMFGGLLVCLVNAFFGFPWRLPVSLIAFMTILAWFDERIEASAAEALTGPAGGAASTPAPPAQSAA